MTEIQTIIRTRRRHAIGTATTTRRNIPVLSVDGLGLTALSLGGSSVRTRTQRVRSMLSWLVTVVMHTLYVELCVRCPMT